MSIECLDGEAKPTGSVRHEGERAVYRVSGRVRLRAEDGTQTTVETRADSDTSDIEYRLVGAEKSFDNGATVFFLGAPQVHTLRDGDPVERVPESYLQWKPYTPDGIWQPYSVAAVESGAVRGLGTLRYIRSGEVYCSMPTGILPKSADITIHPSIDPNRGEVRFTGFGEIVAAVPEVPGLRVRGHKEPDGYRLVMSATNEAPRNVTVVLDWGGRGRMTAELPFPARRAAFLDTSGCPFPENARLAEGSIAGVRAEVVVPDSARYQITGAFFDGHGADMQPSNVLVREIPEVNHGHHMLDLAQMDQEIAERLELSDSPGAAVRLAIVEAESSQPFEGARISISRFDLEFKRLGEKPTVVRLDSRSLEQIGAIDPKELKVEMLPLLEPAEGPIDLRRISRAEWSIPVESLEPGPYLVLGRQGARQRVRPMPWYAGEPPRGPDSVSGATTVAHAYAQAASTGYLSSDEPFGPVVQGMAGNPGHEDWDLVFAYLRHESLPVMTFPLLRALVRNPVACVMAAAAALESDLELLWERMELFPFAWWQIPKTGWTEAYESYAEYWQGQLEKAGDTDQAWHILARHTDASIDRVQSRLPGLHAAFDFLSDRVACRPISNSASKIVTAAKLSALEGQYLEQRLACPLTNAPQLVVPGISSISFEVRRIAAEHPWCQPLFRNEGVEVNEDKSTEFAPGLAAALVVTGMGTSDEIARALRQVRSNHRSWFDETLRLAQLICFGYEQRNKINRHLDNDS